MHRPFRVWIGVWCGWTALGLFLAASNSLTYRSTGRPANWRITISRSLADWWLWALLTPIVVWLARRYPVEGKRRWRNAFTLVAAGLLLAIAKTFADRAVFAWITGIRVYLLASTAAFHFVTFACIVIAAHGVEYYRRSREREQLEGRLNEVKLQMLAMQLQPHFLFNTLNTIAEMVHDDPHTADRMIVRLSDLLRVTLQLDGAQQVTLREEFDLLERYLEIQRARFGERLRVNVQVAPDLQGARVPALLLQPIVENAVRHSVAGRASGGSIDIVARHDDGRLRIDVVDDGEPSNEEDGAGRTGVGLANTRARLEALYGGDYRMELTREADGTRAHLDLPLTAERT